MAAYVISEVKILNEKLAERYRPLAAASIEQYGGHYVVRAGEMELVEGNRDPTRSFVIVEFPSMAEARRWYVSPEYAEALALRRAGALERTLIFVEGV